MEIKALVSRESELEEDETERCFKFSLLGVRANL